MRAMGMHFAAVVTVLAVLAGCVPVPALSPQTPPSEARPPATQPPAAEARPTEAQAQPSTTAPAAAPSEAAPAAGPLAVVKAFEEAYNRHDVDATSDLLKDDGCIAWGDRGKCGYWARQLLLYDAALNRQLELSDCRVEDGRVICNGVQRDVCLAAGGLDETHYAPVVFTFEDGKILLVAATKTREDAQRELLFLYRLAGWAHRTRPAEWDKAGRGDLLDNLWYAPPFVDRTGAAMSALCKEYAAAAAATTTPSPAPVLPETRPVTVTPSSVLFIGDKLSLALDGLFPKLAASGQPSVTVATQLDWYPSAALGAHYELGSALETIRQGKWDVVVLEDDLQADWPARAAEFTEYGRKFDQAIRQAGAQTVFTMVQPAEDEDETTAKEIAAAYTQLGHDLGAKVAPVGPAFLRARRERPDLNLYAADRKQASWAGVYLEGCVLYATIFGRNPAGLTYRMQGPPTHDWQLSEADRYALGVLGFYVPDWEISEKDAADLRRIAWETVQETQAGR